MPDPTAGPNAGSNGGGGAPPQAGQQQQPGQPQPAAAAPLLGQPAPAAAPNGGDGAGQQQQQTGGPPRQTEAYGQDDWRRPIAEALPDVARTLGKFASPTDLARSYAELERRSGGRVYVPDDGDPPEAWAKFHGRLGVPEKPEEYGLKAPEGDAEAAERIGRLAAKAHELRVPKPVAGQLMEFIQAEADAQSARDTERMTAERAAAETTLKREWGADYEANLRVAGATLAAFAGQAGLPANVAELELKDGRRLGNLPELIRVFATVGRRLGLQEGALPDASLSGETKETLQQEADRIMSERDWSLDPTKRGRVDEIYAKLYGEQDLRMGVVPG